MASVRLGSLQLTNRIVMAPTPRSCAWPGALIQPSAVRYGSQRASAGLIVPQAVAISATGTVAWDPWNLEPGPGQGVASRD